MAIFNIDYINESARHKVYDKAAWHIDAGENKREVLSKLKIVFQFLNKKGMLNDDGKEILKSGIDESVSIHEGLLTKEGCKFMDKYYDKVINESSSDVLAALQIYYTRYAKTESLNEASGSSNVINININGKQRSVHFKDKYKYLYHRKKIEKDAISEVKAAITNEDQIKKKIYEFILDDKGHDGYADEDAKSNAGYLDYFEVVENGDGYTINATMNNYPYMITNLKNGKVTPSTKVVYLD